MKSFFLIFALPLALTTTAQAKNVKVMAQELMPIAGTGPDGKIAGVYADLMKAVCSKLSYNCSFEVVPLTRQMKMLKDGEAEFSLGLARSADREEFGYFPPMVTQVGYSFAVKKGTAGKYSKFEDFKGMTVGVHGDSATGRDLHEQDKKLGNILKIVDEAVVETSLRKLSGGRYGDPAAAYCIRPMCILQAQKEKLEVEPVSFDSKIQSHTIMVSKKAVTADEFEKFKKALVEAAANPEFKKLLKDQGFQLHPDIK